MEKIENGKLLISKGNNYVVVELTTLEWDRDGDQELYGFVDGLLEKGYEILDSRKTFSSIGPNAIIYHDRWVLKSPK